MSTSKQKKLFLLDGFGALLSAFLLGVVLVQFEHYFGIPKPTLYFLAFLPCWFAIYDFYCYFKIEPNWGKFLKGIAIANLMYCALSLGFAIYHFGLIKPLGWLYIIGEIILVTAIGLYEWKVATERGKAENANSI